MHTELRRSPRPLNVLLIAGGWEGHQPQLVADWACENLLSHCRVTRHDHLEGLSTDILAAHDLLVPIWTFGALREDQEMALLNAVRDGLGLLAWHGFASAFLGSRPHKFLLGGQFVAHPGGDAITYDVRFSAEHPLSAGLAPCTVTSEQYYLLTDPAVSVMAETTIDGADMPWLAGTRMPTAWTRHWGRGRVAYCALGHTTEVLDIPQVTELLRRAIPWAARPSHAPSLTPVVVLNQTAAAPQ